MDWGKIWDGVEVPVTGNSNYNALIVRLFYSLGGMNYWTYENERRGFYLNVTPVKIVDRGGYNMIEASPMDGAKFLIKEVSRRSVKAANEALEIAKKDADMLIKVVANRNGLKLA